MRLPTTTFILGAGASKPYGLPTGAELKYHLTQKQPPIDLKKYWDSGAHDLSYTYEGFALDFLSSGVESIDQFLKFRGEYSKVGKAAIAAFISRAECSAVVHKKSMYEKPNYSNLTSDWIGWLFNRLITRSKYLNQWPVRFITFNYDRLLEISLAVMYSKCMNVSFEEAYLSVSRSLDICHVYGKVDVDPVSKNQINDNVYCRIKSVDSSPWETSNTIRVIGEERRESEILPDLSSWIAGSKRCVFLGFGFDVQNCEVLGLGVNGWLRTEGPELEWLTCGYGMAGGERATAKRLVSDDLQVGHVGHGCLDFLREHISILD